MKKKKLRTRTMKSPAASGRTAAPATTTRRALLAAAPALPLSASAVPDADRWALGPRALRPQKPLNWDRTLLALPEGYSYRVLQRAGTVMSDGYRAPELPDGMACFPLDAGRLALMRNHELDLAPARGSGPRPPADLCYDKRFAGGVSRLVLDAGSGELLSSNLVLAGTARNCSGGPSPFGFLSCEETTAKRHGYVFLCDPRADRLQPPQRIAAYGRFRHEAVAVDPSTYIAYLTEDQGDSAFYRFVPEDPGRPLSGRLQALAVRDASFADTATAAQGMTYPITWVDIPDPTPTDDSVRRQARSKGAARVVRGEGIWLDRDRVYFTATAGGPNGRGQIFALDIAAQTLTVLATSAGPEQLNMPDNLTVSPHGVVFLAEDGTGPNHLRYLTADGQTPAFARNVGSGSEFAGPCFSPDGHTLFVNLQGDGLTLAITGPFADLPKQVAAASGEPPSDGWPPHPGIAGAAAGLGALALAVLARRRLRTA